MKTIRATINAANILDEAYVCNALVSTCVEILTHISQQTQIPYVILQEECMEDMLAIIQEVHPSSAESPETIIQRVTLGVNKIVAI
tara:strand:- start:10076 stop:10333 length:258 start_codon:yes stop_codon:yes gene_type:complete